MPVIDVQGVSKSFRRHSERRLLREQLRAFLLPGRAQMFQALCDVTFSVGRGESVALVGSNGAGKSTLLSLIAGLARPDCGVVRVEGRVAALLELGSGFHPDLTGRENVLLNAALLGFTEKHVREALPEIVRFAELEDFIDEPIRTYSSGMVVRLAFSVAVNVDPAVLIADEVLGVGDSHFQKKCIDRITQLRAQGRTILSVSHNARMVTEFCDRAIWLNHGRVVMDGDVDRVMKAYSAYSATGELPRDLLLQAGACRHK